MKIPSWRKLYKNIFFPFASPVNSKAAKKEDNKLLGLFMIFFSLSKSFLLFLLEEIIIFIKHNNVKKEKR
jgi:hypothetical protein